MILTRDARRALTHLCLAAMDVAWFAPLLLIVYAASPRPVAVAAWLWSVLVAEMALLDLVHKLESRVWVARIAVVALIAVTYLAGLRLVLYPGVPLRDWRWLRTALATLNPLAPGSHQALVLLVTTFYLWQRAAWASSRSLDLFDVSMAFRAELVLLLAGGGLYRYVAHRQDTGALVWLFLVCGLIALSLTRQRERPPGARKAPPAASRRGHLAWLALLTAGALLGGAAASLMPGPLRGLLGWLVPLWNVVVVLAQVVLVFASMVTVDLVRGLQSLLHGAPAFHAEGLQALAAMVEALIRRLMRAPPVIIPRWAILAVEGLVIALTLGLLAGAVLFFIRLVTPRRATSDAVAVEAAGFPAPGERLAQAAARLRTWARMLRRYGLGRQLLAAVSIQNIYANLCRVARRRGYGRPPAVPPDAHLATLVVAFDGHAPALSRITEAYMRVHYGDRMLDLSQLRALRADYLRILHDS